MREQVANLAGGAVSYLEAGSGPALILLHGGGLDSARLSWGHLVPELARHFRVLAPDWPGYGGSTWSEQRRTTQDLVRCLYELMDHWSVSSACLAGISMGGGVALGMAALHPERVDRLVLVGTYGLQSHAPFHKLSYLMVRLPGVMACSWSLLRHSRWLTRLSLRAIMKDRNAVTEELVEQCHAAVRKPTAGQAFLAWQRSEVLRDGLRTCYADRLRELSQPALLVQGADDRLVPMAAVKSAAVRLPDATLCVLDETGHWPQRERPDKFVDEVLAFIARAAAGVDD